VFMNVFMVCLVYLFFIKTAQEEGEAWMQIIAIVAFEVLTTLFQMVTAKVHAHFAAKTDMEPHSKHWFMGVTSLSEIYKALVLSQLHPSGFTALVVTTCSMSLLTTVILPFLSLRDAEKLKAKETADGGAAVLSEGGEDKVAFAENEFAAEFFMEQFAQFSCLIFYNIFLALVLWGPNQDNYNFSVTEDDFWLSLTYSGVLFGIYTFFLVLSSIFLKYRFGSLYIRRGLELFWGQGGRHVSLRMLESATPVLMGFKFMLKQSNADMFSIIKAQ